jgi:membrane-bound lytic murein transglycosylase D
MRQYIRKNEKQLQRMLQQSGTKLMMMEDILTRFGIPVELKYLAIVESNLNAQAVSSAGAIGPWQFMAGTAKRYGLNISRRQDERKDFRKSTIAAAKYLKDLHEQFGDWLLVIAAYNCGPGRISHAMKKTGTDDFWRLQYQLPEESRNHVKKFLATQFMMENTGVSSSNMSLGLPPNNRIISEKEWQNIDSLEISGRYISKIIAENLGMDKKEFDRYNPTLDETISSAGQFILLLPKEKMNLFKEQKYAILSRCVDLLLQEDTGAL